VAAKFSPVVSAPPRARRLNLSEEEFVTEGECEGDTEEDTDGL